MPDGVLMNGKGPYRYNTTLVPDGIDYETINVQPGNIHLTSCMYYVFYIWISSISLEMYS